MFCKYNDFNINKTLLYEKLIFIIRYVKDVQLMNIKALKLFECMFSKYLKFVEYSIYTDNCYTMSTSQGHIDTLVMTIKILNNLRGSHHGKTEFRL